MPTQPLNTHAPIDPAVQRVIDRHDTICGRCGYNLRGADIGRCGGACPECGLEVTVQTLLGWEKRETVLRRVKRVRRVTRLAAMLVAVAMAAWFAVRLLR